MKIGTSLLMGGVLSLFAFGAQAHATRTWVSGVGDDVNPCSRTAPCKTFAGAISKTAAGGEINIIDPGGFGAVTITKSISIIGVGATAGVLASGTRDRDQRGSQRLRRSARPRHRRGRHRPERHQLPGRRRLVRGGLQHQQVHPEGHQLHTQWRRRNA